MPVADSVVDALERTYLAFSMIPRPNQLDASPLRNGKEILRTLCSAPLRQLTGEQIGPFSGWAITTVGTERDYKHFLPRILDFAVHEPVWLGTEPAIVASKLKLANWDGWTIEQRDAVLCVFETAFVWTAGEHPDETEAAEGWLCGLACLDQDIMRFLDVWRQLDTTNAMLQHACAISSLVASFTDRGCFWDEVSDELRSTVMVWLKSQSTHDLLVSALDMVTPDDKWHIEVALKALAELEII
jgi:hypothetical protein